MATTDMSAKALAEALDYQAKYADTPGYYKGVESNEDLYDIFIKRYGLHVWIQHVEMEMIQYIDRARHKGTYTEDIRKVRVICDRILHELAQQEVKENA